MIELAALREQALPASGRHLLATFDNDQVVVWQAHSGDVARRALAAGRFGGPGWSTDRLSRMRLSLPSLLDRCDWGRRPGRERILAVTLRRQGLDAMLRQAAHGAYEPGVYASPASWRLATRYANVMIGWYPDRDPGGAELARATLRLGLRDAALARFTEEWVVGVEDWTGWVREHRDARRRELPVPRVRPYPLQQGELERLVGTGGADVR